jgi:hypothetical protein
MRDHQPLKIGDFRGTFNRGEEESTPLGYFCDSLNLRFLGKGGVTTRPGVNQSLTLGSVRRIYKYKIIGQASRLLLLDGSNRIYDSTNLSSPILTVTGMTDFSAVTAFDRCYITPHNGVTGLSGEKVYVYSGSGVARAAAGSAPSSFTLTAVDSATSGNVEAGARVFAVIYQTVSGFQTAPGGFVAFTSVGNRKVTIGNLPLGGASVVARYILATKRIVDYAGDTTNQTYYFVPDTGFVADNTTTSIDINFFDADLQGDATYLLERLSEIPAGVAIALIGGLLYVGGENSAPSIVRVSEVGEPESFNEVDGYLTVNPGDAGAGVLNIFGYRTSVYFAKDLRTYVTSPSDNPPSTWPVDEVDSSAGTCAHGVARSLDTGANVTDYTIAADRLGLRLFSGSYAPDEVLTWNIDDIWTSINQAAFKTIEVALDPIQQLIYVAIPTGVATSPNTLLVGDYSEGLTIENIRWTVWDTEVGSPTTIVVDVNSNSVTYLRVGCTEGNVYDLDETATDDEGLAIESYCEFPLLPNDTDGALFHFTGIRMRVKGSGSLLISCRGLDNVATLTALPLTLSSVPGKFYTRGFNFTSESCAVKLRMTGLGEHFTLTRWALMLTEIGDRVV